MTPTTDSLDAPLVIDVTPPTALRRPALPQGMLAGAAADVMPANPARVRRCTRAFSAVAFLSLVLVAVGAGIGEWKLTGIALSALAVNCGWFALTRHTSLVLHKPTRTVIVRKAYGYPSSCVASNEVIYLEQLTTQAWKQPATDGAGHVTRYTIYLTVDREDKRCLRLQTTGVDTADTAVAAWHAYMSQFVGDVFSEASEAAASLLDTTTAADDCSMYTSSPTVSTRGPLLVAPEPLTPQPQLEL